MLSKFIASEIAILFGLICLQIYYRGDFPWEYKTGDVWNISVIMIPIGIFGLIIYWPFF